MLHYIFQIVVFQLLFLMVYDLFLKQETFFNYNRLYLLSTATLSFVLPFVKLDIFRALQPKDFVMVLPEVVIGNLNLANPVDQQMGLQSNAEISVATIPVWQMVLIIGVVLSGLLFIYKLLHLYRLQSVNPKRWKGDVLVVSLLKSNAAFSFFNTIFLGDSLSDEEKPAILKHELVHVRQWHSLDLLVFELMRILLWFNPLVYIYQSRIKDVHEFIADASSLSHQGKKAYYLQLLNQVFETKNLSFTNTFFRTSLIKKRIAMLQKSKSKQTALLKFTLLLPVLFAMLLYVSCDKNTSEIELEQALDLSKFTYTRSIDGNMDSAAQKIHGMFEEFLRNNKDYVSWAKFNNEEGKMKFSIHHKNEVVPDGYTELELNLQDGTPYKAYMNFGKPSSGTITTKEELNPRDYDGKVEVPYAVIDKAPTFRACEQSADEKEKKKCTSQKIAMFVNKNFNTKMASELRLEGKQRIQVLFKIDEAGNVKTVKSRAPHPKLEEEAIRVVSLLPRMIPGEHNGQKVVVPYSLPIIFKIAP